ncbi:DNA primase [Nocardioides sp. AE5]|uniref:DNA primase n=1 Tax=Nocardioides sp. AE5 TaxID=2962573 RepID=UPI002880E886|nr:DNA primase [Nocardioides sp. AE5]MDT0203307.1 DNA primase [Nocardioides sp. AE5]
MAGRIKDEDIAEVREKAKIDDVVSSYVTLRNAGSGSMKGLCPFHDEKSPSFHVTPSRGFFHCFGCQEGGDVFDFLMKIDGLTFTETVERLAEKYGVQLRREDGDGPTKPRGPNRSRLVDAHRHAQEFYADALGSPDALVARQFLDQRGFDRDAATLFGVGFSPRGGEDLLRHLRTKGFNDEELVVAGLVGRGRGLYDKFRGRLMWPIRDASGDVIGFGARRIFDDDRIEAKYLNTAETPIYKKSQVLYGIDLARKTIRDTSRAVVVEGYTDVMACHLAGVTSAVATCGTAFGDEHARVLRRFLVDDDRMKGEVIFTFDGDAAGQNAAMKVFRSDQNFSSQTYVAVAPEGMDPCDLRLKRGDAAVQELVEGRVPLYRFALENIVARFDLDRADSRVDALREASDLVASVRDKSKVEAFTRELARMIGIDVDVARAEVRRASSRPARSTRPQQRQVQPVQQPQAPPLPDLRDPRFALERETLKLVLQHPQVVVRSADGLGPADFTHPTYRGVWQAIASTGGPAAATPTWLAGVRAAATDDAVAAAVSGLGVEPLLKRGEPDTDYVHAHVYRLQEVTALRRIEDLKSRLQRTSQVEHPEEHQSVFAELVAMEQQRRLLRQRAMGA